MVLGVIAVGQGGGNVKCFRGSAGMQQVIMGHNHAIIFFFFEGTDGQGAEEE